jgi:nitroreductase
MVPHSPIRALTSSAVAERSGSARGAPVGQSTGTASPSSSGKKRGRRIWSQIKAFPTRAVHRIIDSIPHSWRAAWVQRASRSPLFVGLYYLWSGDFAREQLATFSGRQIHRQRHAAGHMDAVRYALRRSIHRIEKGLIMRPRREVFAEEYIREAVADYVRLLESHSSSQNAAADPLICWARDVLDLYFDVTGSSPILDKARRAYFALGSAHPPPPQSASPIVPYRRDDQHPTISIDAMTALAHRRRSVRWYEQRPVPRDILDRAMEVARWSPSACNRQPFEFRFFDDPDLIARIVQIPMGTKGFAQQIPCLAVLVGQLRAFPLERDRHLIYIDAALAAMAFEFGLEVQGVSSCSINWPDITEKEELLARTIGLADDERAVMLISCGFPDPAGFVPYSEKKPLDEIRRFNFVGSAASSPESPCRQ